MIRSTIQPKRAAKGRTLRIPCRGERDFAFCPERTALLVIDMQRDFFGDDEDDDPMREIIPRVSRLLGLARSLGCHIVHTRECYAPDLSDVTPYRKSLGYVGREGPSGRFLIRGEAGCDFLEEVRPAKGEAVIDKAGFSAFLGGELRAVLEEARVDHLILCGVTTQCCVHSTLREAVDLGYWCLTVADCCAAEDEAQHDAALLMIQGEGDLFGWIADLANIEVAVSKPGRGQSARRTKKNSRSPGASRV